jgi:hypothetical protein
MSSKKVVSAETLFAGSLMCTTRSSTPRESRASRWPMLP